MLFVFSKSAIIHYHRCNSAGGGSFYWFFGIRVVFPLVILLYCHLQHHNDTIIKTDAERLLYKYNMYLSLYCKGSKMVTQGLRVRGSWRPNRNCNILTLTLMAVTLCLSCSPDAQPEVQRPTLLGDGFLYCILSATSLVPKLHRGSRGPPRPGVVLPTTARLSPSPTLLELNSTA